MRGAGKNLVLQGYKIPKDVNLIDHERVIKLSIYNFPVRCSHGWRCTPGRRCSFHTK